MFNISCLKMITTSQNFIMWLNNDKESLKPWINPVIYTVTTRKLWPWLLLEFLFYFIFQKKSKMAHVKKKFKKKKKCHTTSRKLDSLLPWLKNKMPLLSALQSEVHQKSRWWKRERVRVCLFALQSFWDSIKGYLLTGCYVFLQSCFSFKYRSIFSSWAFQSSSLKKKKKSVCRSCKPIFCKHSVMLIFTIIKEDDSFCEDC